MKVLLYDWVTSVGNKKLPQEMERRGYIVKRFQKDIKDYFYDEEFEKELLKEIEDVDVVFGFNFFPLIARTCYSRNKKYISWCFDCPLFQLFSKETEYETNFIFVFDLEQFKECELIGIKNVYYLPLAANIICDEIKKPLDYQCDVSFVGRLYDDNLYRSIQYMPEHLKGYLEGIMSAQKLIYGADILEELLVPKYMNEIKKYVKLGMNKERYFYLDDKKIFTSLMLEKEISCCEREEIIKSMAEIFDFHLYTYSDTSNWSKVKNLGNANYDTQLGRI